MRPALPIGELGVVHLEVPSAWRLGWHHDNEDIVDDNGNGYEDDGDHDDVLKFKLWWHHMAA